MRGKRSEEWVGVRLGKLIITEFLGLTSFGRGQSAYFKFKCDCGNEFVAQKSNVIGKKKDCGCSETKSVGTSPRGFTHHPLSKIWRALISRCYLDTDGSYPDYGARGISVCGRWIDGENGLTGFECFVDDMGMRPKGNYTVERIEVNGNYEPSNCKWLHKSGQSKNRRNVPMITIDGRTMCIPDWCRETGVGYWVAVHRIKRKGWPPSVAVTIPNGIHSFAPTGEHQ